MKETYSSTTDKISEHDDKIEIATTKIQELEELHDQNMDISAAGQLIFIILLWAIIIYYKWSIRSLIILPYCHPRCILHMTPHPSPVSKTSLLKTPHKENMPTIYSSVKSNVQKNKRLEYLLKSMTRLLKKKRRLRRSAKKKLRITGISFGSQWFIIIPTALRIYTIK